MMSAMLVMLRQVLVSSRKGVFVYAPTKEDEEREL